MSAFAFRKNLETLTYGPVDEEYIEKTKKDFADRMIVAASRKYNSVNLTFVHKDKRVYQKLREWMNSLCVSYEVSRSTDLGTTCEYITFITSW